MIPVACVVIHNFICIHKPDDWLLQQYNIDGHTVQKVDPRARRRCDDEDNNVPVGVVVLNLVVGQDVMSRIKDEMANKMFAALQRNPWYRQ